MSAKAEIAGQANRLEPELRAPLISIDMHVRRLMGLMAVEVEGIWPNAQYRRNRYIVTVPALRATPFWTERPPPCWTSFSKSHGSVPALPHRLCIPAAQNTKATPENALLGGHQAIQTHYRGLQ
jgi:hypothetical protein